jgi:D-glycero-D-manno-heptose 1,7-bisphosphate phosphatase
MSKSAVVFLDRDGTIIEDVDYIREPHKVALLPNAGAGLRMMTEKGYLLFVVSNQSGIGRGLIQQDELDAVHARFIELLARERITIAGYGYCYHRPEENCSCRKPRHGLIPQTLGGRDVDYAACFTVGDKDTDLFLADSIGAKGFLVLTGKGVRTRAEMEPAVLARFPVKPDLLAAAQEMPVYSKA